MTAPGWVLLARLIRPQGRKGELIAQIFTDFPNRFKERPRVFLASAQATTPPREILIEKHWLHQGRVVLKFAGIDSINDAEALRGFEVVVPQEDRVPLTDDAVYVSDLVGCHVIDLRDDTRMDLGEVIDVERGLGDAPDLLVVRNSARKRSPEEPALRLEAKKTKPREPLLVPFAKSYLVGVDLVAKRITMRLPEGLADLNEGPDLAQEEAAG